MTCYHQPALRAVTQASNGRFWVIVSAIIAPQPMIPSNNTPPPCALPSYSFLSYLVMNLINCCRKSQNPTTSAISYSGSHILGVKFKDNLTDYAMCSFNFECELHTLWSLYIEKRGNGAFLFIGNEERCTWNVQGDNKFHVWNYKGHQQLIESCGCKRGMNAHKFVKSNEWLSKKNCKVISGYSRNKKIPGYNNGQQLIWSRGCKRVMS